MTFLGQATCLHLNGFAPETVGEKNFLMGKNYLRIKKNNEFQKIFAKGKRGFSSRLTLLYQPSDKTRMGICVSKKHGGSVTRNRIKRLLREIFRLNENKIKKNYAYILVPRTAEDYKYRELEKDFLFILKKHDLLEKKEEENGKR